MMNFEGRLRLRARVRRLNRRRVRRDGVPLPPGRSDLPRSGLQRRPARPERGARFVLKIMDFAKTMRDFELKFRFFLHKNTIELAVPISAAEDPAADHGRL